MNGRLIMKCSHVEYFVMCTQIINYIAIFKKRNHAILKIYKFIKCT